MKLGILGFLLASLIGAIMKFSARRRAAQLEGHGGCVACGVEPAPAIHCQSWASGG